MLKNCNGSKALIEYSNDMDDVYENIEGYNPNKERKILIRFDDMLADFVDDIYGNIEEYNPNKERKALVVFDNMFSDLISNKNLKLIVTELFIRGRKLNISFIFIAEYCFDVPKILD